MDDQIYNPQTKTWVKNNARNRKIILSQNTIGEYKIIDIILEGQDEYAIQGPSRQSKIQIYLGEDTLGQKVVLKRYVRRAAFEKERDVYNELQRKYTIYHRNYCQCLESLDSDNTLVLQFVETKPFSEVHFKKSMIALENLAKAVIHMHDLGIVHKDLRFSDDGTGNIIFDGREFVIIDFDSACFENKKTCSYKNGYGYKIDKQNLTWDDWKEIEVRKAITLITDLIKNHIHNKGARRFFSSIDNLENLVAIMKTLATDRKAFHS